MAEKKTAPKRKVAKKKSPGKVVNRPARDKAPQEEKFAVVKIGGSQQKVKEGDVLEVNRVEGKEGGKLFLKEVLLVDSSKGVKIGTPFVSGSEVTFKILEHGKGEKIEIRKFRAKSRYRRKTGHRQLLSKLRVEKIS